MHKYAAIGLLCLVAFGSGVALERWGFEPKTIPSVRLGTDEYSYINPLLLCRNYRDEKFSELEDLKRELERITASAQQGKVIDTSAIYVRDLNTGYWTGINEDEEYEPASLLKVPILMAYLSLAQSNPRILEEQVYYTRDSGQEPPLVEKPLLESGRYYSTESLLRGMIVDSDNSATKILEGRINKDFLQDIYAELGIRSPYNSNDTYRISTRTYGLFFRVLYNSTFLSRAMSEKAFGMLAEVKFNKGLRAGTSAGTPVAHKYGYRIIKSDPPRLIELSDCGVIYQPSAPYLLCVMARGSDPEDTSVYIKDIAAAANHFFSQQR
jgi:beta-lactamase class A